MAQEVKTVTVFVDLTRRALQTARVGVRVPKDKDDDWVRSKLSDVYEEYSRGGEWSDVVDDDVVEGTHEREVDRTCDPEEDHDVDLVPKCDHCGVEDVAEEGGRCGECARLYCPACGEEVEYDDVAGMCDACLAARNAAEDEEQAEDGEEETCA